MQPGYLARASLTMFRHPLQGLERVRGRLDRRHDLRQLAMSESAAPEIYQTVTDWEPRLHAMLGIDWPCDAAAEFQQRWSSLVDEVTATGARFGLSSYARWSDGDVAFAGAIWCVIAHTRPTRVVETGVAHGVTSRIILEGLERNGQGDLYSIDLPAVDSNLRGEIGMAVPERLRGRWTYVEGTTRSRLPSVLVELGEIDLFVHDSLHTGRNVRMELDRAWPVLRPGGVAVVDDVDHSFGFRTFLDSHEPLAWFTAPHVAGRGLFGLAIKPSLPSS
ncbi:MAG: hypothetical protein QOI06_2298 [Nocardioidaceae bacterium]|nr:hypothetical protein [Nocardioidaceae bacterium]